MRIVFIRIPILSNFLEFGNAAVVDTFKRAFEEVERKLQIPY